MLGRQPAKRWLCQKWQAIVVYKFRTYATCFRNAREIVSFSPLLFWLLSQASQDISSLKNIAGETGKKLTSIASSLMNDLQDRILWAHWSPLQTRVRGKLLITGQGHWSTAWEFICLLCQAKPLQLFPEECVNLGHLCSRWCMSHIHYYRMYAELLNKLQNDGCLTINNICEFPLLKLDL